MKTFALLLFLAVTNISFSQDATQPLLCDTVIMTDGTKHVVQVDHVGRFYVSYYLCCEDCNWPRDFKAKEVDTIIFNTISLKQSLTDSASAFEAKPVPSDFKGVIMYKGDEQILIKIGKPISVETTTHTYSGTLTSVKHDTLYIGTQAVPFSDLISIKFMPVKRLVQGFVTTFSAPVLLTAGLGVWLDSWATGGEVFENIASVFFVSTIINVPVGLIIGLPKFSKKKMQIDKGWQITVQT